MIFTHLPELFFAPLASPNRHHYAALLLTYYRLFLEYHHGVERDLVVDRFASYFASLDSPAAPGEILDNEDEEGPSDILTPDPRGLAAAVLRKLISYGWMDEEEQLDFTRLVTIKSYARPFFEALDATDRGAAVEYESHVVAIYSSLGSDAADDSGEHAVLNAHMHTRLLLESLKLLDQNIRAHLQELFSRDATVPELLHAHYDVYMHEVIDRAYTRLKTSDNLSRYRPRILKRINAFLVDDDWLQRTADRLSVIKRSSFEAAREELRRMLVEIRNDLQAIDPLLERIDDRNRRYSRISTERIRSQIHADRGLAGKITAIVQAWADGTPPRRHRITSCTPCTVCAISPPGRSTRAEAEVSPRKALRRSDDAPVDVEAAEREIVLRARGQLSPRKVAAFLEAAAPYPGNAARAETLLTNLDSYIRLLYAGAYAEGRPDSFPYTVEWGSETRQVGRFRITDHRFVRRYPDG